MIPGIIKVKASVISQGGRQVDFICASKSLMIKTCKKKLKMIKSYKS